MYDITGGQVTTRASRIHFIAEDPGKDGTEKAVLPISEIVSQAKSITLRSEDAEGVFATPAYGGITGIELDSETGIILDATLGNETKKNTLKSKKDSLIIKIGWGGGT